MDDDRDRRIAALLSSYYGSDDPVVNAASAIDIDSPQFDADAFVRNLFANSSLSEILEKHSNLQQELQNCQASLQSVVYKNYKKYIEACEQIKSMRDALQGLEPDMKALATTMDSLSSATHHVSSALASRRGAVEKLWRLDGMLGKVQFLVDLPQRLRADVDALAFSSAVDAYTHGATMLARYDRILSFRRIAAESDAIIAELIHAARNQLLTASPDSATAAATATTTGTTSTSSAASRVSVAAFTLLALGMPPSEVLRIGLAPHVAALTTALKTILVPCSYHALSTAHHGTSGAASHASSVVSGSSLAGLGASGFEAAVVDAVCLIARRRGSDSEAETWDDQAKGQSTAAAAAGGGSGGRGGAGGARGDVADAAALASEPVDLALRRLDAAVGVAIAGIRTLFKLLRSAASSLGMAGVAVGEGEDEYGAPALISPHSDFTVDEGGPRKGGAAAAAGGNDAHFSTARELDVIAAVAVPVFVLGARALAAAVARRVSARVWKSVKEGGDTAAPSRAAVLQPAIDAAQDGWAVVSNGLAASARMHLPSSLFTSDSSSYSALYRWCTDHSLSDLAAPPPPRVVIPAPVREARLAALAARNAGGGGKDEEHPEGRGRGVGSTDVGAKGAEKASVSIADAATARDDPVAAMATPQPSTSLPPIQRPPLLHLMSVLSEGGDCLLSRHIVPWLTHIPKRPIVTAEQIITAAAFAQCAVEAELPQALVRSSASALSSAQYTRTLKRGNSAEALGATASYTSAGGGGDGDGTSQDRGGGAGDLTGPLRQASMTVAVLNSTAIALAHIFCRTKTLHTFAGLLADVVATKAARESELSAAAEASVAAAGAANGVGGGGSGSGTPSGAASPPESSDPRPTAPSSWLEGLIDGLRSTSATLQATLPTSSGDGFAARKYNERRGVRGGGVDGVSDAGEEGGSLDYRTPAVLRQTTLRSDVHAMGIGLKRRTALARPRLYVLPDVVEKEALMQHIIAYVLKSLLEVVRSSTLSLREFRQLQVDVYVLRSATVRWVSDVASHHIACDAVLEAAVDRCVAAGGPVPLEPSAVDTACAVRLSSLCL